MNNEELIKVLMDIPEKEFTKLIYQVERQRELRDRWENIEKATQAAILKAEEYRKEAEEHRKEKEAYRKEKEASMLRIEEYLKEKEALEKQIELLQEEIV